MAKKRSGLGMGLGALIPNSTPNNTPNNTPKKRGIDELIPRNLEPKINHNLNNQKPAKQTESSQNRTVQKLGDVNVKEELQSIPGAKFAQIDVSQIIANRQNPREVFDEDELNSLASSISELGVLQPIRVRVLPKDALHLAKNGEKYELIAGERRLRASKLAKQKTIPAIIADVKDDNILSEALVENLHRVDLNPLEEALAYDQLIKDFNLTQQSLADKLAISRSKIANLLRLTRAPLAIQKRIASGVLSEGHARTLLSIKDQKIMEDYANRVILEGISVRSLEEMVALLDSDVNNDTNKKKTSKVKVIKSSKNIKEFNNIAEKIAEKLDTVVDIKLKRNNNGELFIKFADLEDLERIFGEMFK